MFAIPDAPGPAWWLGHAGLLPFLAIALGLWVLPEYAPELTRLILTYAAVIATFMGAVHWGLAMRGSGAQARAQYLASVVPSLITWAALQAPAGPALLVTALTFVAIYLFDRWAVAQALAPAWYLPLRTRLTSVVLICLVLAWAAPGFA